MKASATKYELFVGHIVRKKEQDEKIARKKVEDEEIARCFEWIRFGPVNKRIVVYINFKMKVEQVRFRESILQYYRKSGISVHGAAVFYRQDMTNYGDHLERMKNYSEEYERKTSRSEEV